MELRLLRTLSIAAMVALCCFAFVDTAAAQCVLCRASVARNAAFARSLNLGVLVLLVPPVSIFCTIFFMAFRHRKS
jgi:hypothetical protein